MVKDHSDSERGNLLAPLHGLLFPLAPPLPTPVIYIMYFKILLKYALLVEEERNILFNYALGTV